MATEHSLLQTLFNRFFDTFPSPESESQVAQDHVDALINATCFVHLFLRPQLLCVPPVFNAVVAALEQKVYHTAPLGIILTYLLNIAG
jgi:hypothetical protein